MIGIQMWGKSLKLFVNLLSDLITTKHFFESGNWLPGYLPPALPVLRRNKWPHMICDCLCDGLSLYSMERLHVKNWSLGWSNKKLASRCTPSSSFRIFQASKPLCSLPWAVISCKETSTGINQQFTSHDRFFPVPSADKARFQWLPVAFMPQVWPLGGSVHFKHLLLDGWSLFAELLAAMYVYRRIFRDEIQKVSLRGFLQFLHAWCQGC